MVLCLVFAFSQNNGEPSKAELSYNSNAKNKPPSYADLIHSTCSLVAGLGTRLTVLTALVTALVTVFLQLDAPPE